jgi:hypothetical protein
VNPALRELVSTIRATHTGIDSSISERTKNNGKRNSGEFLFPFSASLQWLCPSTREEEEVI